MENTTELRLAWRQEFASCLLDEMEHNSCKMSDHDLINDFCNRYIFIGNWVSELRGLEFSVMGYMVKRKLKNKGVTSVIDYLTMIEEVFTEYHPSLH
jgi:hypothetical protein